MTLKVGTFDIETDNLLDSCTQVWCAVVMDHATGKLTVFDPSNIGDLCNFLDSFDVLIGHNCIAFDFPVLRKLYGWEFKGAKVDTLIMSRMQRPNRTTPSGSGSGPHSVESWGVRLGSDKVANDVWDSYHPLILKRCIQDVKLQYRIYKALLEEGKGEGWKEAHKLTFKLFHYLQLQEEYGWKVDQERLDGNIRLLNRWIDRIDNSVRDTLPIKVEIKETKKDGEVNYVKKPFLKNGGHSLSVTNWFGDNCDCVIGPFSRVEFRKIDLDSNQEAKEFLLDLGWKPKEWNYAQDGTKRSAKLSKDDPFQGIRGGLGKLIAKRVQCRHRLSTLEGWKERIRPDGRLSTPVGGIASTGRIKHKDVVNVPGSDSFFGKQMRSIFTASDGWDLVGVDSKGNQIRQLAARMGDDEFTNAVLYGSSEDGTDLHSLNQRRSGASTRTKAKNFFYGFIFGAQAPRIAKEISIPVKEAQGLIDKYLGELPLLKKLIDDSTVEWRKTAQVRWDSRTGKSRYYNGYITGLDGRPILVDAEHKVLCYMLQSDEAIQMAAAYVWFHKQMEKRGYKLHRDWGMLIWYHDEIQFECKPEITEEAKALACESIAWAGRWFNIKCPHEGDAKHGRNWAETH